MINGAVTSYMPPDFSGFYQPDGLAACAIGGGYLTVKSRITPDGRHLLASQYGGSVFLSSRVPHLIRPVVCVIGAGAKKHMVHVDTKPHITFVADAQIVRHRSLCDQPRQAMRQLLFPGDGENAISRVMTWSRPQRAPASVRRSRIVGNALLQCPMTRRVKAGSFVNSHDGTSYAVLGQGRGGRFSVTRPAQFTISTALNQPLSASNERKRACK